MSFFSDVIKYNPISMLWNMASSDTTVESDEFDERNFVANAQKAGVDEKKIKELAGSLINFATKGKKYIKDEGNTIKLDSDEEGYNKSEANNTTSKSEYATAYRDTAMMEEVRQTGIKNVPAGDLPNNPREKGGQSRGARKK